MKIKYYFFVFANFVVSYLISSDALSRQLEVMDAFPTELTRPVGAEFSHSGSPYLYVYTRDGLIKRFDKGQPDLEPVDWFNLPEDVFLRSEGGLLGLAFHPEYPENPSFFVNFTYEDNGQYKTRITRFLAPGEIADPNSEQVILEFDQPAENHNGGALAFGPDGYLYISSGDGGGSAKDNPQNTLNLLGGILRIDIDTDDGYIIPPDNPFVGNPEGLDELYAWGLRNPWRMSFDKETGHLWVADVGSDLKEIIHIVEKGKNYGYPIIEGSVCKSSGCDTSGLEMPIFEYGWNLEETGRSITGGYVYRGSDNPSLYGKYIYGDYVSGRMWALEVDHETLEVISNTELVDTDLRIPSFGQDSDNEMYVIGWGETSKVYRFATELTLTTPALKSVDGSSAVQLSWETNRDTGIDSFEIYKGSTVSEMNLLRTVPGTDLGFIDPDPLDGSTFYTVRAIETDGTAGEMSEPVSYYRTTSTISNRWQMISLPFETGGLSIENTIAYIFDGAYSEVNQLEPGKGYWIRSIVNEGSEYFADGIGIQRMTLQLTQGWNLISGVIGELSKESIIDNGNILDSTPMYGYSGSSYVESSMISPAQGFLIYAVDDGEIAIDLDSEINGKELSSITEEKSLQTKKADVNELDKLKFSVNGQSFNFYVSTQSISDNFRSQFRVPPMAPGSSIDVRTDDGFQITFNKRFQPNITTRELPLTLKLENTSRVNSQNIYYEYTVWRNGLSESFELKEGGIQVITQEFDRIEFQRIEGDIEIVKETELLPSYPNPFNPVTTIAYRLSERQQVLLTVFDAAGRRIASLVDREQDAGQYTLPFDASGLASGIYFVRFNAGDVLSTQKLTLIK